MSSASNLNPNYPLDWILDNNESDHYYYTHHHHHPHLYYPISNAPGGMMDIEEASSSSSPSTNATALDQTSRPHQLTNADSAISLNTLHNNASSAPSSPTSRTAPALGNTNAAILNQGDRVTVVNSIQDLNTTLSQLVNDDGQGKPNGSTTNGLWNRGHARSSSHASALGQPSYHAKALGYKNSSSMPWRTTMPAQPVAPILKSAMQNDMDDILNEIESSIDEINLLQQTNPHQQQVYPMHQTQQQQQPTQFHQYVYEPFTPISPVSTNSSFQFAMEPQQQEQQQQQQQPHQFVYQPQQYQSLSRAVGKTPNLNPIRKKSLENHPYQQQNLQQNQENAAQPQAQAYAPSQAQPPNPPFTANVTAGSLMSKTGTYFGPIERLHQRIHPDDTIRWSRYFMVVDGSRVHLFRVDPELTDKPIETLTMMDRSVTTTTSGGGRGVFAMTAFNGRWFFRAASDDEAEAWTAIFNSSLQRATAERLLMMPSSLKGSLKSNGPYHNGGVAMTYQYSLSSVDPTQSYLPHNPTHNVGSTGTNAPRRQGIPPPLTIQQHHLPYHPTSQQPLTPASPNDPLPSFISPMATTRPPSPPMPPANPGVFRSRRNSDSDLSMTADPDFRLPSLRSGRSRTRTAEEGSSYSNDSGGAGSGSFKINKVWGIRGGGTNNGGDSYVYLVRGGARQPGGLPTTTVTTSPQSILSPSSNPASPTTATPSRPQQPFMSPTSPGRTSLSSSNSSTHSASSNPQILTAKPQVVILSQAPALPSTSTQQATAKKEKPKEPPKQARVFMVRGGSQFRRAPDANRLVTVTLPANPKVAGAGDGGSDAGSGKSVSEESGGGGVGKKVYLVRTASKKKP
ncbi:hypothetical protein HDU97_008240 [Phlyctochytrium planicorne]|nr:hypothetical protein HDU97_008240 [Phlyctochytrium planicorne]